MNQGGITIWLYRLFAFFWQYWLIGQNVVYRRTWLIGQNVLALCVMSLVKWLNIAYRTDYFDLLYTECIEAVLDSLNLTK